VTLERGLWAGLIAGAVSGVPSTAYCLATGGDLLASTRAAGSILPGERRNTRTLVAAGVGVHLVVSAIWGVALSALLPRSSAWAWGAGAGLAIGWVDLVVIGRGYPMIRSLPLGPQLTDHVVYGAVAGACLSRLEKERYPPPA
jgi:hypothetical protein